MAVSKTDFVRALQCEKMLWLDAHKPELKVIPPEVQAKLDAGNEFGDEAMGIFGPFTETTAFKDDGRLDFAKMIERTQALLLSGEDVICEGSFSWYGNFCAADILKKEKDGYSLYEVKNAYLPRREFIVDLGFQRLVLRKCGVKLLSSKLILRGDTPEQELPPTPFDESAEIVESNGFLYKLVDVTAEAKIFERMASEKVFDFGRLKKKDAPTPEIAVGEHCDKPYRCWYYEYCHGADEN